MVPKRLAHLIDAPRRKLARWRNPITLAAMTLFLAGSIWSFTSLELSLARLDLAALLALTVPMGLVMLVYSALSLMLMAQAAGVKISLLVALRASGRAQLAEALPLPGGAIVRAAALMNAGASLATSSALVIATALLWIALAALAAGIILAISAPVAGWTMFGSGLAISLAALVYIARLGGLANAALTLTHRLAGLGIASVRLWLSFMVVQATLPLANTYPYVLAAIAGSASSIAPGGLGISEALGAVMAEAIHASPQSAFLALAMNRIAQYLGTGLFLPFFEFDAGPKTMKNP